MPPLNQSEKIDNDIFELMRDFKEGKDVVAIMIDNYSKKDLKWLITSLLIVISDIQDKIENANDSYCLNLRDSSVTPLKEKKEIFGAFRLKLLEAITIKNARGGRKKKTKSS